METVFIVINEERYIQAAFKSRGQASAYVQKLVRECTEEARGSTEWKFFAGLYDIIEMPLD